MINNDNQINICQFSGTITHVSTLDMAETNNKRLVPYCTFTIAQSNPNNIPDTIIQLSAISDLASKIFATAQKGDVVLVHANYTNVPVLTQNPAFLISFFAFIQKDNLSLVLNQLP